MKKLLAVLLVVFTVYMSYVFVGGFIESQQPKKVDVTVTTKSTPTPTTVTPATTTTTPVSAPTASYDVAEIARHNVRTDCWLLINNKIYDVTAYFGKHPGGASTIAADCGKESTVSYDTYGSGSGSGHSGRADSLLAEYLIGVLK